MKESSSKNVDIGGSSFRQDWWFLNAFVLKWSPEGKMPGNIPGIFSGQRVKWNIFGGETLLELSRTCAGAEDTSELSRMQL